MLVVNCWEGAVAAWLSLVISAIFRPSAPGGIGQNAGKPAQVLVRLRQIRAAQAKSASPTITATPPSSANGA
jgi:hypothetical protein